MQIARLFHAQFDQRRTPELSPVLMATFRDVDRPALASPPIHILKNVPVDSFQVRCIELTNQRRRVEFNKPHWRPICFEGVKLVGIADVGMFRRTSVPGYV